MNTDPSQPVSDASDPAAVTILLVEDQPALLRLLQTVLQRQGYVVLVAENGMAALEAAASHVGRIDVLVSDMMMPRISGLDLARELSGAHPDLKIILMSGFIDETQTGIAGLDLQPVFIQKPFPMTDLVQQVQVLLAAGG